MFITAFRPQVGDSYAPATAAAVKAEPTAAGERFVSGSGGRLAEVDAMAALAQAAKAKIKAELPEDLRAAVTAELGKSGITSFEDQRVKTLTGYLVEGWEAPFFDPVKTLGEGWVQQEHEVFPLFQPQVFTRQGDTVIQQLSFDQKAGTTTLHTIHSESLISTRHYQIVQDREGKVIITDERAV
jgi:hypothetical protein